MKTGGLVGRDREIAEVAESVASVPLTTLTGPGRRGQDRAGAGGRGRVVSAVSRRRVRRLARFVAVSGPRRQRGGRPGRDAAVRGSVERGRAHPAGLPTAMSCWCSTTASTSCRPWPISSRISPRGSRASTCSRRVESRCGSSTR